MQKLIACAIMSLMIVFSACSQTTRPTTQPTSQATTQASIDSDKMNKTMEAPYSSIGDYPESYSAASVMQRAIDGLGYRYHWASEGLTATDLAYEPGNSGKPAHEVLRHILSLSYTILKTVKGQPNIRPESSTDMDFEVIRLQTLQNLKEASDFLNASTDYDMEENNVIFQRGEKKSKHPFWRLINGPLLDAVYHTGQIVSYRRTTGNPSNPKVNVFSGSSPNQ